MKVVVRFLFVVLVIFSSNSVFADDKLMPLEEVQRLIDSSTNKAVKARFSTVLKGTKIESLKIVIRDVFRQPGFEVIVFTSKHQIAAGMSGSPTYVDGKNIGAVAYSFNGFSDEYWGGISPISNMMKDAEFESQKSTLVRSFVYKGKTFTPIATGYESISGSDFFANQKFVRTTSSGGSDLVKSRLNSSVLKPGMPIVVDLVEWTDEKGKTSTLGATGTITYIDDKGRIFNFGHPFYNSKNVVYSFRTAEIIGTIPSELYSFKLTGRTSDVLGAITYDSSCGIYGKIGAKEELKRLRHFKLEFKNRGVSYHKFDIKVADSVMTPMLVQAAFKMIGEEYGAPLAEETSVTQIESSIDFEGHQPISWKGLFPSSSTKFGSQTLYSSSFDSAREVFFTNIYAALSENNYGLKISDVSVSVNFIPGTSQTYKMGAYKFPNKVVYGQDPVLDVMFVDENNKMPIAKRITVKVDWDKVERPSYTSEINVTEKVSEKIVGGVLSIQSSNLYLMSLSGEEKQRVLPGYFLNPEDFLENLSRRLDITNQKIFVKAGFRAKSGLFDEIMAKSEDIMPTGITADEDGWHVIRGGLRERKVTLKDSGAVYFNVSLPDSPDGYIFDQGINEFIQFEVVLEN